MPKTEQPLEVADGDPISIGELIKLLDIKRTQFEYWRKTFDPVQTRKKFFDSHIYAYFVLKYAIQFHRFSVDDARLLNWDIVFEGCEIEDDELVDLTFYIDVLDEEVLLLSQDDEKPTPRMSWQLLDIPMVHIFETLYKRRNRKRKSKDRKITTYKELIVARHKKKISSS